MNLQIFSMLTMVGSFLTMFVVCWQADKRQSSRFGDFCSDHVLSLTCTTGFLAGLSMALLFHFELAVLIASMFAGGVFGLLLAFTMAFRSVRRGF